MLALRPKDLSTLAGLSAGLVGGAFSVSLSAAVGGAPASWALGAAAVLTALAVGAWPRFADRRAPGPARLASRGLLPLGAILALDPLSSLLRVADLSPRGLPWALAAVVGLSLAPWARGVGGLVRARTPLFCGAAAIGLALALGAPPWASAGAGLGLGLLAAQRRGAASAAPPAPAGWGDLLPIAAVTFGALAVAVQVRALVAPGLLGAGVAAVSLLAAIGVGRALSGGGATARLAWAAAGLLTLIALEPVVGSAARDLALTAGAEADDPRLWLLAGPVLVGLLGGLAVGGAAGRAPLPAHAPALALGAIGWVAADGAVSLPVALGILGASALLGFGAAGRRAVGAGAVALAVALSIVVPPGDAHSVASGAWRLLRGQDEVERDAAARALQEPVAAAITPWGTAALRADPGPERPDPTRPVSRSWTLELDGVVASTRGRQADAERLAALLAVTLTEATPSRQVLLLGDEAARMLPIVLGGDPAQTTVSVPAPEALRAAAGLDPQAREAWLHPTVRLREGHPAAVLRATRPADAIVEVFRTPWGSAAQATPGHEAAIHRHLKPGGVYVAVLHLGWWTAGTPAALAERLAGAFDHVQLWLPPSGVDSLVVVASDAQQSLARLEQGAQAHRRVLSSLGLPDATVLASHAVGSGATARDWAARAGQPLRTTGLSRAVFSRPSLHLDALATSAAGATEIWDLSGASIEAVALDQQIGARRTFLALLGEAAQGDLAEVFAAAKALVEQDGAQATRALQVLIEPHMKQARQALLRARVEGLSSSGWEEAQRFASTARMLSPLSPDPPLMLAEIALEQGNFNTANELFEQVLELEPGHLGALGGLARTAQARRDYDAALRWLREATTAHGQDWQAWQNLGVQLWRLERYEEAEQVLRRASSLAGPDRPEPHIALAQLYLDLDRPTTALVHAERAVVLQGGPAASFFRGRAHLELGELTAAEADFRKAALLSPSDPLPRLGIAQVRAQRGDLEAAAEALRAVLAIDPDHVAARENLRRTEEALRAREFLPPDGQPTGP